MINHVPYCLTMFPYSMKSWQFFDSFVWFVFVIWIYLANSVPNKLGKRWALAVHFNHSVLDDISIKAWNMQNCQMAFSLLSSGIASISLWKMCALSENGIGMFELFLQSMQHLVHYNGTSFAVEQSTTWWADENPWMCSTSFQCLGMRFLCFHLPSRESLNTHD